MSKTGHENLKADLTMAKLMERIGPIKLRPHRLPPFQSLIQAVIHQQLNGKAAATILKRFLSFFGKDGFPTPKMILHASPKQLRATGLSRAKTAYICDIARRARDGHVPSLVECDKMSDDELIDTLTQIKGVGRWTVEMLLISNLGRPDVLPVHDLGIRRGFQVAYGKRKLPEPDHLAKYGQRWAPRRTTAALYLWRAADILNGEQ